jgi:periplasmic divalent cation tolerance protein
MQVSFVYITTANRAEAQQIGRTLVEERLAACVNIFDNMDAIYWWADEVQEIGEVVIIAKTREELVDGLVERVKGMHSYNCPCIVVLPITNGNPAYIEWIRDETRPAETLVIQ